MTGKKTKSKKKYKTYKTMQRNVIDLSITPKQLRETVRSLSRTIQNFIFDFCL